MNVEDVERRVAEIEREKDDFERAHGMQDALYRDVLRAFADCESPLALAALKAEDIEFDRYMA